MVTPWTWLRRVFPAKTFHSRDRVPDLPENALDCSGASYEPFAWWDGQDCCWRTWQRCLVEGWATFSGPWPPSGMTRSGIAYRRVTLVSPIGDSESSLLPTPTVCGNYNRVGASATSGDGFCTAFKKRYGRFPTAEETERVMGFPKGWTDWGTPSSLKSQS